MTWREFLTIYFFYIQIFEVKPENKRQLPVGTRVCVYWSRAYNCLFPGTIEDLDDIVLDKDNMVQVLLDDGDRRQVDVASVRMLPQDYSHVGKFNLEVVDSSTIMACIEAE